MRVIEVIMALFIIVFAISFASMLSITPASPKYQSTELEKLGYNVLHDLDKQGLLPTFVYNNQWNDITSALRVSFPINVYFNLTVYQISQTTIQDSIAHHYEESNGEKIFYGEVDAFNLSTDVASVTYCMVGFTYKISPGEYQAEYDPRILILELTQG